MKGQENRQDDFLSHAVYDSMIPSDHFFRRVGNERFVRIFNKIVGTARDAGLIADRMHAIDARVVRANVATWRRRDRNIENDDVDTPSGFIKFDDTPPGSRDPDAAWGRKSKNDKFYGYKHHISTDVDSGFITESVVTPGNEHDGR